MYEEQANTDTRACTCVDVHARVKAYAYRESQWDRCGLNFSKTANEISEIKEGEEKWTNILEKAELSSRSEILVMKYTKEDWRKGKIGNEKKKKHRR